MKIPAGAAHAIAVALLATACATIEFAGTYEAVLPAASAGGERHVAVVLDRNGGATLTSAFPGRPSRYLVKGTWERQGSRITLNLEKQKPLVFEHAGNSLIAREWDHAAWGEAGPGTLRRR